MYSIIFNLILDCSDVAEDIPLDFIPQLVLLFFCTQLLLRELRKCQRLVLSMPLDMSTYYGKYNAHQLSLSKPLFTSLCCWFDGLVDQAQQWLFANWVLFSLGEKKSFQVCLVQLWWWWSWDIIIISPRVLSLITFMSSSKLFLNQKNVCRFFSFCSTISSQQRTALALQTSVKYSPKSFCAVRSTPTSIKRKFVL